MRGQFVQTVLASEIPQQVADRLRAGEVIMDGLMDAQDNYVPVVVQWEVDAEGNEAFNVYKRPESQHTWSYCDTDGLFKIHKLAKHESGSNVRGEVVASAAIISGVYVLGYPYVLGYAALAGKSYPTIEAAVHAFNCN